MKLPEKFETRIYVCAHLSSWRDEGYRLFASDKDVSTGADSECVVVAEGTFSIPLNPVDLEPLFIGQLRAKQAKIKEAAEGEVQILEGEIQKLLALEHKE